MLPYLSFQGKNHSKKLRNFYAGSQQPPAIRIPEALEGAGQTALSSGSNDTDAARQVRILHSNSTPTNECCCCFT